MNPKLNVMTEGAAENMRQWQKIVDERNRKEREAREDLTTI